MTSVSSVISCSTASVPQPSLLSQFPLLSPVQLHHFAPLALFASVSPAQRYSFLLVHPLFGKAQTLTEPIIAAAIEVHRDKGPGLIESIYEWCLLKELELRRLGCVGQKSILIEYKGFTREEPLRFDVLVEVKVRRVFEVM